MLRYSEKLLEKESSISAIYFRAKDELDKRKELYAQFRRKYTDSELASLSDENIKVPLERYLSVMSIGYFSGIPPVYKVHAYDKDREKLISELFDSKGNDEKAIEEIEQIINHIASYNDDGEEFQKLAFDYLVKRACYEIIYKNEENEIVYANSDALETIAIWNYDYDKKLIGLYRVIDTIMADGRYETMVELTTKTGKRFFNATHEKIELFSKHNIEYKKKYKDKPLFQEKKDKYEPPKWQNELPVVAIENEHNLNIFESVSSLIRAYERVIQNSRNTFQYNDDAILAVTGYEPENKSIINDENNNPILNPARELEDEHVLKGRVRYLEKDGKIEWVLKQVNDSALQNHKKTLMDLICLCAFIPNMTDLGFTQADNNSALEKKFFSLQQLISTADSEFKKGFIRRWRLILNKFNAEKGKNYDYRDIEVTLLRNIPSDKASETSRVLSLRGVLPDKTIIGMLPDDLDPNNELQKLKEQNESNLEDNIEKIKNFGSDSNSQVSLDKKNESDVGDEQSKDIDSKMEDNTNEVRGIPQEVSKVKQKDTR